MIAATTHRTQRASAAELLNFLQHDPALIHSTRVFFEILADNTPETLCELGSKTFDSYIRKWQKEHEPLLSTEVLPRLSALHPLLLRAATSGNQILAREFSFLESEAGAVKEDLGSIYLGLSWLRNQPNSRLIAEGVIQAAQRFLTSLLGGESATLRLLGRLRQERIHSTAERFRDSIRALFAARGQLAEVTLEGLSNIDATAAIFAPPDVVSACTDNVLANLHKHAFPPNGRTEPKVALCFGERRNEHSEPMAVVTIKNNGKAITANAQVSASAKRAQSNLQMFGGYYSAPSHTDEMPWHVVHTITFLLW